MNFTKWVLAGCVWLLASAVSASPLDAARTLLGTGTLDSEATEQIFHQALGAKEALINSPKFAIMSG